MGYEDTVTRQMQGLRGEVSSSPKMHQAQVSEGAFAPHKPVDKKGRWYLWTMHPAYIPSSHATAQLVWADMFP